MGHTTWISKYLSDIPWQALRGALLYQPLPRFVTFLGFTESQLFPSRWKEQSDNCQAIHQRIYVNWARQSGHS